MSGSPTTSLKHALDQNNTVVRLGLWCVRSVQSLLLVLGLLLSTHVQAQFGYKRNGDAVAITSYTGSDSVVIIPDTLNGLPVTSIDAYAFQWRTITSVVIPDSVTNIGPSAFLYCYLLTDLKLGSGVISIGASAFSGTKLASIIIPGTVLTIGKGAFVETMLTNVVIPDSVTNIGEEVFLDCDHLLEIEVSVGNPAYSSTGGVLFSKDQVALLQYPPGLPGPYTIPNGVTHIGNRAFYSCGGLTGVTLPEGVVSIGTEAFNGTRIGKVAIPESVLAIGDGAFQRCLDLDAINVDANNTAYKSIEGVLFNKDGTILIAYPAGRAGNYAVPNSVTWIGDYAFESCFTLTNVLIQGNVTNIGTGAFNASYYLASVCFLGNAPETVGVGAFLNIRSPTLYYTPATIGWDSPFAGVRAILWNPQVQTTGGDFGIRSNRFGFTVLGNSNLVLVVEASTDLNNPVWSPVATKNLTGGSVYFSDPDWTNHAARFYRLRSP